MTRKVTLSIIVGFVGALLFSFVAQATDVDTPNFFQNPENYAKLIESDTIIESVKAPKIEKPEWLVKQETAKNNRTNIPTRLTSPTAKTITYDVATRGNIRASFEEFKNQSNATLNDSRGWSKLGMKFNQVTSGGMFTLVLSEASFLPSFSSGCSVEYSCRVGRYVVINQDRWLGATSAWNNAGGSLRDYRNMVVNHEVGHWLGHDHISCSSQNNPAPVMQQQSISLQGCRFNAWPLDDELWTSR